MVNTSPHLIEQPQLSYGTTGITPTDRNMLIKGDNLPAMRALINMGYTGTVDCVQIDPPYNTGYDFGDYSDAQETQTWRSSIEQRIQLMLTLLKDTGFLLCHIDDTLSHDLRGILDNTFGRQNYWGTFYVNTKHVDPSMPDESPAVVMILPLST